jgi:hypothetical protein
MSKAKSSAPQVKTQPPAPAKTTGFNAKQWAKDGVSEEEVIIAKTAFDLFDSDQGGSVDIKGTLTPYHRAQSCHDFTRILIQKRCHLPDAFRS